MPASPLQAFAPLASQPGAFLLFRENAAGQPYALWGSQPRAHLTIHAREKNALALLERFLAENELWQNHGKSIAVGYLGYEFGRHLLPARQHDPTFHETSLGGFPDLWLGVYEQVHQQRAALPLPDPCFLHAGFDAGSCSNYSADDYQRAVARILDYIRAGDLYQANLAQCFTLPWESAKNPFELFQNLLRQNPGPQSAYLRLDDERAVLSCSPELFLRAENERIVTEPIKGTIGRGGDPRQDETNRLDLVQSAKNRAELTMIVDLLRNDLGRICAAGSIEAARLPQLKTFASVHHLVGKIEGKLREGTTLTEILQATFPGGSITGAPKLRAAQVIAELEKSPRGVYCGAIGSIGPGHRLDFNIAIRTLMISGRKAYVHAGAGIVAESDPAKEYEETLAKIAPILNCLGA